MRTLVHSTFEHAQDNVIIAADESLDFCALSIVQVRQVHTPLIAGFARDFGDNRMNSVIELCVDFEHEFAEVGQTSRVRYARTNDKEHFAMRMHKKEAFGNSRQARTQYNYSVVNGVIAN